MSGLVLCFLGPPLVELDGVVLHLERRKSLALLALLEVSGGGRSREELTELLYPRLDRGHARAGFRKVLSGLRNEIGHRWLGTDRYGISLLGSGHIRIDVLEFRAHLDTFRALPQALPAAQRTGPLRRAAREYRGEFLSGFFLKDSIAFEEWQLLERDRLQQEHAFALEQLIQLSLAQADAGRAILYAHRLLAVDPLDERVHRLLMELYARSDQRSAALRQYESCRSLLKKELDVAPEDETRALFEEIRSQERKAKSGSSPERCAPLGLLAPAKPTARSADRGETAILLVADGRRCTVPPYAGPAAWSRKVGERITSRAGGVLAVRNALCFALFSTPESALAAALEIQSSLCRRSPAAEGTEEWGYVPVSRDGAQLLFQAVSACYEKRSMIITTNLEFGRWVNIFLDQTMTTALIDRLVHYSHLLIFDGESHRVKTSLMRR